MMLAGSCGGDAKITDTIEFKQFVYGSDPSEFGHFWMPATDQPLTVVVLVHGGFWRRGFNSDLMEPLASDLYDRGYAVWNIEYGRVGEAKGGFPFTLEHVGAAIDYLAVLGEQYRLDLEQVVVVGHSAGGHLALWAGSRELLPDGAPGANPVVEPKLVVGQGAVSDLYTAAQDRIGNGAVVDFLGGTPDEEPERYAIAQPQQGSADILLVNGGEDRIVEPRYSVRGDLAASEVLVEEVDHFDLIDPTSPAWTVVLAALPPPTP